MDGWLDGCMSGWMGGWMDARVGGWMVDGCVSGWVDGWLAGVGRDKSLRDSERQRNREED